MPTAGKAYAGSNKLKRARIDLEQQVQDPIEQMLGQVYAKVKTRIRQGRRVA